MKLYHNALIKAVNKKLDLLQRSSVISTLRFKETISAISWKLSTNSGKTVFITIFSRGMELCLDKEHFMKIEVPETHRGALWPHQIVKAVSKIPKRIKSARENTARLDCNVSYFSA